MLPFQLRGRLPNGELISQESGRCSTFFSQPRRQSLLFDVNYPLTDKNSPFTLPPFESKLLLHSIHDEKRTVDFYQAMAGQCVGAPMERMFKTLAEDEEGHLARIEELYESMYLKDR